SLLSRSAEGKAASRSPSGRADAAHQELADGPADIGDRRRAVRSYRVSGMAGDTHQYGVWNVRGRLDGILDRIVEVQFGNEQQNRGTDRPQRRNGIAAKPRRLSYVMRVTGKALIDPV